MNKMDLRFSARIENEPFARTAMAAFITPLNPTVEEIMEIKTLVAEAVSNAIIHGYNYDDTKYVYVKATLLSAHELEIVIQDYGVGIENIEKAREACFTTRPDQERSGMGFTIMQSLSDSLNINSILGLGTKLTIKKTLATVLEEVK